ncbi:MG2 domain-containing protein [Planctomycetes bacterium K23_9]|uniref:alpha-2-macroglobulin family protein n=1 Tax=Stieleria marina TaxID=1930275 RepID=UPI0011AB092A
MTFRRILTTCLLLFTVAAAAFTYSIAADPTTAGWKAVREAINKGLPKSAIEKLDPIITAARDAGRYDEAIRAISLKIALEGNIQGNKPEEKITRMKAEIAAAPNEMKPVLNAILANWYWHYFQQNRWRFMQRTQTAAPPGEDFTTWDLSRILAEIDQQFQRTLTGAETLKQTPVADYDDLLDKGTAPDAYRPTMYDVLVHNALEFYSAGEQAGGRSMDAYDLPADSPVFSSANDFIAWKPDSTDQESPTLKAILLYQELLSFHADDDDRSAFLDADLQRLIFAKNMAFGEEKTARFESAIKRMMEGHNDHNISSRAAHQLATSVHSGGDWVKAREIAKAGMQLFPGSVGSNLCYNLIQQIESREGSVNTERVWNQSAATIDVTYRNVTKFHFRLVRFDFDGFIRSNLWSPEQMSREQRAALLAARPIKSWVSDLPQTDDFKQRVHSVPPPEDIPAGSYYLMASHKADFSEADNVVSFTQIWVSELALITRNHNGKGVVDGFILNAKSGEPIVGATVKAWARSNQNQRLAQPATTTDRNGMFRFAVNNNRQLMFYASKDGQQLATANYISSYSGRQNKPYQQTQFFTDRAIYRPGQTIHYKGICLNVNKAKDDYQTIANRELTIQFTDVNGKEIETRKHRTNDYGSFSGSVTAPRDRLMGRMRIVVKGGPTGQTQFRVEEYKRPKFQVEVDPPIEPAKLGGLVKLTGKATAYTGAAINDAKVAYRVVRGVHYPAWWFRRCWWMPATGNSNQEISHGVLTTKADGTFDIQFDALPDLSIPQESEPTFHYTVYADVTDTTGETRSNQRMVPVGYTSLSATVSADRWLTDNKPVQLTIRTTTLSGQGESAKGVVKVYSLQQPERVARPPLRRRYYSYRGYGNPPSPDPSNPDSWELGEVVFEKQFETDASGNIKIPVELTAGMFRSTVQTQDQFGKKVTAETQLRVIAPESKTFSIKIPHLFDAEKSTVEVGEQYKAVWGSGYHQARAFIEIIHRGKVLKSYWTAPDVTQAVIEQNADESMRGGFNVRCTMVRENRAYLTSNYVPVPWSNKKLNIKWERFVSKLKPGAKERWTAIVSGPDAQLAAAEMVATLYDASLDAYASHNWISGFNVFRRDYASVNAHFENQLRGLQRIHGNWRRDSRHTSWTYRRFPGEIIQNFYGYQFGRRGRAFGRGGMMGMGMADNMRMEMDSAEGMDMGMAMTKSAPMSALAVTSDDKSGAIVNEPGSRNDDGKAGGQQTPNIDLENVTARKNLNETAFFFPHLTAGQDGSVKMEFTMPEALTKWKFIGFAHDRELRGGAITGTTVTAKDLMVQPNPPRFIREGDMLEFTAKVSNQSPKRQTGTIRLALSDARTGDSVDDLLKNVEREQSFEVAAGESKSYAWKISVPDGLGFLTYKVIGSTGRLSDGEEGYLPVLSRRLLVTESLPLPIRGKQTKDFEFKKLLESGNSDSLKHQSLTVQMVSNPSWYAVMALPYLMEYPHECAEQTFNRLYANSIAQHIAGSDPKIHRVFDQWRNTPALDSPLEKNEDLKSVMLQETPWVRQAEAESQARRNVGILFDDNRLASETQRLTRRISDLQYPSGAWPWFPGGPESEYITLYITTGFGRMRHLGVDIDPAAAIKSLDRLDAWATNRYREIKPANRDGNHLSTTMAFYVYGRSFFLQDKPIAPQHKEAVDYWLSQSRKYWLDLAHRQSQAHLAIALKRFGDLKNAQAIMASIKERSVSDEEMGMFWRDTELSWWWYRAPIETQAMMIEAFDEVMNDAQAVEDCKVWLIKQKQTQDWKTTKATADAVYALLLRGTDVLASDALVEVSLADTKLQPDKVEAGTGFFEQRFVGKQITPELGKVRLTKVDDGVAWGSLHWQYLEDVSKVTPHQDTPLKLTKQLFVKKNTDKGPTLVAVDGPVDVGDELVVRVVLRTDRDMEYVHLKDGRGSGTEPVNVLSRYKFQDGLGYYESTRDTASHFFIDYLPKGVYVFEYSTRVQLRGQYQTGIASVQCMYAPEFNSHSESLPIEAK